MSDNLKPYAGVVFPEEWDQDEGTPDVHSVANAIQVWGLFHPGTKTVREVATAFNLDDSQVQQAVESHYWMFLDGPDDDPTKQTIEQDGE